MPKLPGCPAGAIDVHGMKVTPELVEQVRAYIQLVPETGR